MQKLRFETQDDVRFAFYFIVARLFAYRPGQFSEVLCAGSCRDFVFSDRYSNPSPASVYCKIHKFR